MSLQKRIADLLCDRLADFGVEDCRLMADELAETLSDELSLTEEWALTRGGGRQTVMSEELAKDRASRRPESFGTAWRYVTNWVDA